MKKLLVLTLVLGIASLAPAALQISVNGDPEPVDSEIIIAPSEELILDIHGNLAPGEGLNWLYVVSSAQGSIDVSTAIAAGAASKINEQVGQAYFTDYFLYYAGLTASPVVHDPAFSAASGIWGDLGALGPVLLDGVIFHCEGLEDAIIQLYSSPDQGVWTLEDTAIIHQIPEPATMALLGLGALVLRRKK